MLCLNFVFLLHPGGVGWCNSQEAIDFLKHMNASKGEPTNWQTHVKFCHLLRMWKNPKSDIRFFSILWRSGRVIIFHPCWGSQQQTVPANCSGHGIFWGGSGKVSQKQTFRSLHLGQLIPGKKSLDIDDIDWLTWSIFLLEGFIWIHGVQHLLEHVLSGLKGMWPDYMVTFRGYHVKHHKSTMVTQGIFGPGPHLFRRLSWRLLAAVASRRSSSMCTWGRRDLSPLEISVTWQVFLRKPLDILYLLVGKELGFFAVGWWDLGGQFVSCSIVLR